MKKVCMNYNEFMSKFKNASKSYAGSANISNNDSKSGSKVDANLSNTSISGKGTSVLSKLTTQHLNNIKNKTSVNSAGKKR
jgi:hypothetical protein